MALFTPRSRDMNTRTGLAPRTLPVHLMYFSSILQGIIFHNTLLVRSFFLSGHGNGFVTSEPKLLYLKSPGVKFMNHFTDLRNPLLKSFGSYKV